MTESRAYINEIENEQTIIMNPDILPTQKEWRLICKMVKEQEKKIIDLAFDLEYARRTDEWLKETDEQVIANAEKRFPFLKRRELTDEEIDDVWVETCSAFKLIENGKTRGVVNIYDVSRAILRKASEK
jgi:hypothetical protein